MTSEQAHQNICPCCNEPVEVPDLPLDYSFKLPDEIMIILAQGDQDWRISRPNSALVNIDAEHFYVRGLIELPIIHTNESLAFGVWIKITEEEYNTCLQAWSNDIPEKRIFEGQILGLLSNAFLRLYPDATNLIVAGFDREDMAVQFILEPTDHPLSLEQHNGITIDRVREIAEFMTRRFNLG